MIGIKRPKIDYMVLCLIMFVLVVVIVGVMHLVIRALGLVMFKLTWIVVLAILIGIYVWMRKKEDGESPQ
jgi:hypothetical protein